MRTLSLCVAPIVALAAPLGMGLHGWDHPRPAPPDDQCCGRANGPRATPQELSRGIREAWKGMCAVVGVAEPTSLSQCVASLDADERVFTLTAVIDWDKERNPGQPFGALEILRAYPRRITASNDRSTLPAAVNAKIESYRDAIIVAKFRTARGEANFFVVAAATVTRVDPAERGFAGTGLVAPASIHPDLPAAETAAAALVAYFEAESTKVWMDSHGRLPPNIPAAPEKGFVEAWKDIRSVPAPPPEFCSEPHALPERPPPPGPGAHG